MVFDALKFACGVKIDDFIYASCLEFNGLYRINIKSGSSEFICQFPNEVLVKRSLHRNAFKYENKIIFVPSRASNIHIYDLNNNHINVVQIVRNDYQGGYVGEIIDGKIFLTPEVRGGNIIEFDIATESVKLLFTWDKLKNYLDIAGKTDLLFVRITKIDNRLILPICMTSKVLIFNTQTAELEDVVLDINEIFGCFAGKDRIWVLGECGEKIFSWSVDNGEIKEYFYPESAYESGRELNWIVEYNDNVYVFPAYGKRVLILSNENFIELMSCEEDIGGDQKYFSPICSEGYVIVLPFGTPNLLKICGNKVLRSKINDMDRNSYIYNKLISDYMDKSEKEIFQEGNFLSLEHFIEGVAQA